MTNKRNLGFLVALSFILGLFFISFNSIKVQGFDVPTPNDDFFVLDSANILSNETKQELIQIAKGLESSPERPQIVLVTIDDLYGESIESYSNQLFNSWGIGSEELDNGVLLVYVHDKPSYRIEVGYGLEGAITDSEAGRILDEVIALKESDGIEKGLAHGFKRVANEVSVEYGIDDTIVETMDVDVKNEFSIMDYLTVYDIIVLIVFVFVILDVISSKNNRNYSGSGSSRSYGSSSSISRSSSSSRSSGRGGSSGGGGASR